MSDTQQSKASEQFNRLSAHATEAQSKTTVEEAQYAILGVALARSDADQAALATA